MAAALLCGCSRKPLILRADSDFVERPSASKADEISGYGLPADFPVAQDLAVIFPLFTEVGIRPNLQTVSGDALLPEEWLDAVIAGYEDTVVEDAIQQENRYEDWRIASVRFAPCGPLGHHFGQAPSTLCWPQVRLVWQPVYEDLMVLWVRPFFADDRAIHALYHVMPATGEADALEVVREHVANGGTMETLSSKLLEEFLTQRNAAIERWMSLVVGLREDGRSPGDTLGVRTELNTMDEAESDRFTARLEAVLASTALPAHLFDLTSFSLPEGRDAPQIDLWAFIAFDPMPDGSLHQRSILVRSPEDGRVIGDAGLDETVTMTGGDQELGSWRQEGALAEELTSFVVFSLDNKPFLEDVINDPEQTMVPNTSCASCHRFNEQRFDFHALSYLEDNEATISPRVVNDVAHELRWLRAALGR